LFYALKALFVLAVWSYPYLARGLATLVVFLWGKCWALTRWSIRNVQAALTSSTARGFYRWAATQIANGFKRIYKMTIRHIRGK